MVEIEKKWAVKSENPVKYLPFQDTEGNATKAVLGEEDSANPRVYFSFPFPKSAPVFLNSSQGLIWEMSQDGQIFGENSDSPWLTGRATKGSSYWRPKLWVGQSWVLLKIVCFYMQRSQFLCALPVLMVGTERHRLAQSQRQWGKYVLFQIQVLSLWL